MKYNGGSVVNSANDSVAPSCSERTVIPEQLAASITTDMLDSEHSLLSLGVSAGMCAHGRDCGSNNICNNDQKVTVIKERRGNTNNASATTYRVSQQILIQEC